MSTSECSLDGKQIHEQLHNDSDSFSEISQDSDIGIIAEISKPDFGGSDSTSDDSHGSVNVGVVMMVVKTMMTVIMKVGLWDEYDQDFCKIPCMPHLVINHLKVGKCRFLHAKLFCSF